MPTSSPAIAVSIAGEWTREGVRLRFQIPEGIPVRDWRVEKETGGQAPVVVSDASSHLDGVAARECIDPSGGGGFRYRLTVAIDRLGEPALVRSDWVAVLTPAVGGWSVSPHPWNGRGWLRLPSGVARGEKVDLFEPDGGRLSRLEASGDRITLPDGRIPATGVYFLRWRDANGRERSARLVIER